MKYALGNMLNGAGGLNADQLALDLQFAADKTLTARKGPTPVFTRGSTGTFVGSNGLIQSAGNNVARFDHDPVTLASKGLLIEEGRTNLILQSEDFGTTWSNDSGAVTITTNVETSPDGSTSADKIAEAASTTSRRICIQNISVTSGTTYSYSCYIKAGERDFAQLAAGTGLNSAFQNFVVNGVGAGTLGSSSGIVSSRIDAMPNGWYRCTMVATATATGATTITVGPAPSSTLTRWQSYASTAGSGIYAWGAQLEAGSFPTSYIPTTTSALARSADVCNITAGAFTGFWNQSEGTLFSRTQKASTNSNAFIISASDGSFNNETDLRYSTVSQVAALINVSNISQLSGIQANITSGAAVKSSIAYKLNDCAYAANGASPILDTSALIPTLDRLTIGNVAVAGNNFYLNGHIVAIRYYRKRLPNAKLQALTA